MSITAKKINRDAEVGKGEMKYYEVFARKTSKDRLGHVGSIEAPNDELAQVRAWFVHDEHSWIEMCIAPIDSIISVTGKGKRAEIKEA